MRTIKYTNQVSLVFPSRSANESFARSAAAAFAAQLDPTLDELGACENRRQRGRDQRHCPCLPRLLGKGRAQAPPLPRQRAGAHCPGLGHRHCRR